MCAQGLLRTFDELFSRFKRDCCLDEISKATGLKMTKNSELFKPIDTPASSSQLTGSLASYVDFLHIITEFLELFWEIIPHYGHGIDRFFQPRCIVRTSFGLESRTDCQSGRVARPKEHV
jgi:hypothetical protein